MFPILDENNSIISPYNSWNDIKYPSSYTDYDDLRDILSMNSVNLFNENELLFTNISTLDVLNDSNIQQNDVIEPIDGKYSIKKIQQILLYCKNPHLNDIIEKIKREQIEKDKEQQFLKLMNIGPIKLRKQEKWENKAAKNKNIFGKCRKRKIDLSIRAHNKFSYDNIIKKNKAILFNNLIAFCNNILESENINVKLKKINYKYVNKLDKKNELELFEMTIKQVISKEISSKYTSLNPDYNKEKIAQILEERKDNEFLKSLFKMPYRQWIDIFILKLNNINYKNDKSLVGLDAENFKKIEENMPKISEVLININSKYDIKYLHSFLSCLYNYEQWFLIKRNRRGNKS